MIAKTTRHKADGGVYNGCVRLTTLVPRSNFTLQTGRPGSTCLLMSCSRKFVCVLSQWCPTLCNPMDCSTPSSSVHGDSPEKNTGEGCHALLPGILTTQGSNPGILHCRHILLLTESQRSPRILEWVAYPFSRGSSQPRNRTRVSCIAGGFFTS